MATEFKSARKLVHAFTLCDEELREINVIIKEEEKCEGQADFDLNVCFDDDEEETC